VSLSAVIPGRGPIARSRASYDALCRQPGIHNHRSNLRSRARHERPGLWIPGSGIQVGQADLDGRPRNDSGEWRQASRMRLLAQIRRRVRTRLANLRRHRHAASELVARVSLRCHSGARALAREPGIHNHRSACDPVHDTSVRNDSGANGAQQAEYDACQVAHVRTASRSPESSTASSRAARPPTPALARCASARASSVGGTVRPSALAVLRLGLA
jgi:hypothetical protein